MITALSIRAKFKKKSIPKKHIQVLLKILKMCLIFFWSPLWNGHFYLSHFCSLTPGWQLRTTEQLLNARSSVRWGEKQKFKLRKSISDIKDRLIGTAKAVHTSKEKSTGYSPVPKGRQFSNLQESWSPSCITVTCQDKHHHPKCASLFLLLHPSCIAEHDPV